MKREHLKQVRIEGGYRIANTPFRVLRDETDGSWQVHDDREWVSCQQGGIDTLADAIETVAQIMEAQ